MAEQLLTVKQVSTLFQVPKSWIYKRICKRAPHRMPHVKLGKYVRFRESEVENFVAGCRRA